MFIVVAPFSVEVDAVHIHFGTSMPFRRRERPSHRFIPETWVTVSRRRGSPRSRCDMSRDQRSLSRSAYMVAPALQGVPQWGLAEDQIAAVHPDFREAVY